jgi:hypothetical protein
MWPSASTIEKFAWAIGMPEKNSASSRLSGWLACAEDSQEEPGVGEGFRRRTHPVDRGGLQAPASGTARCLGLATLRSSPHYS